LAQEVADRLGARVCTDGKGLQIALFIEDVSTAERLFTAEEFLSMSAEAPWPVESGSIRSLVSKRWPNLPLSAAGLDGGYVRHVTRGDGTELGLKGPGAVPTAAVWVQIPVGFRDASARAVRQHVLAFIGRTALPEVTPATGEAAKRERAEKLSALDAALAAVLRGLQVRLEGITLLSEAQYTLARAAEVAGAAAPPAPPPPAPFDSIEVQPLVPGSECLLMWSIVPSTARRVGYVFHVDVDGERVGTGVAKDGTQSWFQFPAGKAPCSRAGTHRVAVLATESDTSEPFAQAEVSVTGERLPPHLTAVFLLEGPTDIPWLIVTRPEGWESDVALQLKVGVSEWTTLPVASQDLGGQIVFRMPTKLRRGGGPILVRSRLAEKESKPVAATWLNVQVSRGERPR
jgi:hypothetical protein